jgi:voltage-gated potassium channel
MRSKLHEIIFEADTTAGKAFDIFLLVFICFSVLAVLLESVAGIRARFGPVLKATEWFFTILFTIEYILRLYCVGKPLLYVRSFYGIVDLLSVIPTYLSLFFTGVHSLIVIRALRLLRVFRILKLGQFLGEAAMLKASLAASSKKIILFLGTVVSLVLIIGSIMYLIEGEQNGFTSIPQSIYWAVVTMTTVGYGDIAPQTLGGKILASAVMIIGYAIIAVPTGIVTVHLAKVERKGITTKACPQCAAEGHDADAKHCKYCGARL